MAEYSFLEKSLSVTERDPYDSQTGQYTATASFRAFCDVSIAETSTAATVTAIPKETISVSGSGSGFGGRGSAEIKAVQSHDSRLNMQLGSTNKDFGLLDSGHVYTDSRPSRTITLNSSGLSVTVEKTKEPQQILLRTTIGGTVGTLSVTGQVSTYSEFRQDAIDWFAKVTPDTHYITIPPIPSYTITYDTDGGSAAPASQTKWYNEALSLSNIKPTKDGYKFMGWRASNGREYQLGATYTANEATTLTAIWEETKVSVKVKTGGEWKEGELRAKVNGRWVYADALFMKVNGAWIRIER